MKRITVMSIWIALAGSAQTWAAPNAHDATPDYSVFYFVLMLAVVGMSVGTLAGVKKGFSLGRATIGGFLLGPFAFLLFFIPTPASGSGNSLQRLFCVGPRSSDVTAGEDCHRTIDHEPGVPEPSQRQPTRKTKSKRAAKSKRETKPTAHTEPPASVFAEESEMLRQTMPGALVRTERIDYAEKFVHEDVARCSSPDCGRLLPPPYHRCPHCGTVQV